MPHISSNFHPKFPFRNAHFSTIYASKLRPSPKVIQQRERLYLPDTDFLDIDWSLSNKTATRVAIVLHGLEGNAQRTYMKGTAKILIENGWDVAATNHRGCSGEKNLAYQSYNVGKTDDLESVIDFILEKDRYSIIALIGFSLGGNILLKYLGERETHPKEIKKAVAISTPLNLKGSLDSLSEYHNWIYRYSFLKDLREKYKTKMQDFPEKMHAADLKKITSLLQFDTIYTAPSHGFKDALDYYDKNSSLQFLPNIKIPILIMNAENDSFLSSECYPLDLASQMNNFFLETPKYGGHVGFHQTNEVYYNETRTLEFLNG